MRMILVHVQTQSTCSTCSLIHTAFLFDIFFGPEIAGDMFLPNVC
jgi:hypothetical protein